MKINLSELYQRVGSALGVSAVQTDEVADNAAGERVRKGWEALNAFEQAGDQLKARGVSAEDIRVWMRESRP